MVREAVMAAQGAPPAPGPVASQTLPFDELQEYEKILKIRDEIFSGTHPRLKVSEQFVKRVTPRLPPTGPAAASGSSQGQTEVPKPSQLRPNITQAGSATRTSTITSSAHQPSRVAPKPSSELDPIFLTKSDDLVRAELQLQRQRVERALREQVEQTRQESKLKESLQEAKPDFDVVEVLNAALEIVKPLASSDTQRADAAYLLSDPSDGNSFYSSKAPDSSQNEEQVLSDLEGGGHPMAAGGVRTDAAVDDPMRDQRLNVPHNYVTDRTTLAAQPSPLDFTIRTDSEDEHLPHRLQDVPDEPEYIPPEPEMPILDSRDRGEHRRDVSNHERRNQDYTSGRRLAPRSLSPNHDVSIVIRNHITSPAAPQPSRVSPLATAKVASANRLPHSHEHYQHDRVPSNPYSGRESPDGPAPQLLPRKRRRMHESGRTSGYGTVRRPNMGSPGPYIKEEPMSPAPLLDAPSPYFQRSRPVQDRPLYVVDSPRYTPVLERREPQKAALYEVDRYGNQRDYEPHAEASVSRSASRISVHRPARDQQDLRRVASLHNARNSEIGRDIDVSSTGHTRPMRAATYTFVERPQHESPRYYDEIESPYSRRYVRVDELPPSPRYREVGVDEEYVPRQSVITHRRVIVDEYGNRYYEDIPALAPRGEAISPPSPRRYPRVDEYNERAYARNGNAREMSIVEDQYGERRYVQEMPPPQATYRRVVDHPRGIVEERRPYSRMLEREPAYRSGSTMVEYAPRQPAYIEEPELGRERLVRVSSVRPPPSRYEEPPRAVVHRLQSVRPGDRRDVSVYVDEDARGHRNVIERPVYTSSRPMREELYYEEEDGPRLVLEGDREAVRRVVSHRF